MCGLLGFIGDHPADPGKLRILYLVNKSRGTDSTGLYGNRMMKKVGEADVLLKDPNFDSIATSRMVMGHTRSSTGTAKTKENAHPFMYGQGSDYFVVGTHNGSIFNEYEMEKKINGFTKADVDSASIYKAIHHTKDIKKVIQMLEGHVALAFRVNQYMYLYRRESRPLFLGKTKEGWYYSSIKDGLRLISIPEESIYDLTPHKLLCFRGSKIVLKEDMPLPRVAMDVSKTSYNWDYGISNDLKEELTGKKYIPVVTRQITTGTVTTLATGTDVKVTTGSNSKEKSEGLELHVRQARVISIAEMKSPEAPRLYGKSILMASSRIDSGHEYMEFMRSHFRNKECSNVVYPNYFNSDATIPFWPKDVTTVIADTIHLIPQLIERRSDSHKNDSINISIKPLFFNEISNIISMAYGQSMFMFVTLDDVMISKSNPKKYFSEAVAYFPVVHDRRNGDGYLNFNIPAFVAREVDSGTVRLRIAIADVRNKGFIWETTVSLEKGCDYGFTGLMRGSSETKFSSARNIFAATKGEAVSIDGFKGAAAGFTPVSLDSNADLKIAIKGALRAIEQSNMVIPLFLDTHISRRESRTILQAINSVRQSKNIKLPTESYGEYTSRNFDCDDKKKIIHYD